MSPGLAGLRSGVRLATMQSHKRTSRDSTRLIGDRRRGWHELVACRISFWAILPRPLGCAHCDSLRASCSCFLLRPWLTLAWQKMARKEVKVMSKTPRRHRMVLRRSRAIWAGSEGLIGCSKNQKSCDPARAVMHGGELAGASDRVGGERQPRWNTGRLSLK